MGSDLSDLHEQGFDIGKVLESGDSDKARKSYDALILRIQDESKGQPAEAERRMGAINAGMAQADPTDVKSPGNGTEKGFYIYWNTENIVTETNDKINAFCRGHNNCLALDWSQMHASAAAFQYTPPNFFDSFQKDDKEMGKFLADTNDWLYKKIPDGLERHTFKDDFNRRRLKSALEAVMDDSLSVVIKERAR